MPFDRDVQLNANGSSLDRNTADRTVQGIRAHSAPLGFIFLHGTAFPSAYPSGVALAYHGSWNCSQKTGYKVAYFAFDPTTGQPGDQIELVNGWASASSTWGRPVDVAADAQGALFISDNQTGAIYRLVYTSAPPPPTTVTYYQAEQATISGASVSKYFGGYTCTGYVDLNATAGAYVQFVVNAAAGSYTLAFRYVRRTRNVPLELRVNDQLVASAFTFNQTGSWTTWRDATFSTTLNAGANTIRLTTTSTSGPHFDRLGVGP